MVETSNRGSILPHYSKDNNIFTLGPSDSEKRNNVFTTIEKKVVVLSLNPIQPAAPSSTLFRVVEDAVLCYTLTI